MDQDMVISMVQEKSEKGIKVSTIISDDGTTTMLRLRQSISPNIEKITDRNHIKKNFSSSLYSLQKTQKNLDVKNDSLFSEVLQLSTSSESG